MLRKKSSNAVNSDCVQKSMQGNNEWTNSCLPEKQTRTSFEECFQRAKQHKSAKRLGCIKKVLSRSGSSKTCMKKSSGALNSDCMEISMKGNHDWTNSCLPEEQPITPFDKYIQLAKQNKCETRLGCMKKVLSRSGSSKMLRKKSSNAVNSDRVKKVISRSGLSKVLRKESSDTLKTTSTKSTLKTTSTSSTLKTTSTSSTLKTTSASEIDHLKIRVDRQSKQHGLGPNCSTLQKPSPNANLTPPKRMNPSMWKRSRTSLAVNKLLPVEMEDNVQSVLLPALSRPWRNSQYAQKFSLPPHSHRSSALLFVDISGFTKLSTAMELEEFSDTINSYFESIVSEILKHEGDILKFAGDALFAEWRANGECPLEKCTATAAYCGSQIVAKCSDFKVPGCSVTLNVHCGLGVGSLVGLHVDDDKCTRRQFLVLGEVIDQVAEAEATASHGEIVASVQAIELLSRCCRLSNSITSLDTPSVIASRSKSYVIPTLVNQNWKASRDVMSEQRECLCQDWKASRNVMKEQRESLTCHQPELCQIRVENENTPVLKIEMMRRRLSLYIHPVICEDEFSKQLEPVYSSNRDLARRKRRAEAEIRSVYTMFIKAQIDARVTGCAEEDGKLFKTLDDIMKAVCCELDAYQGQLRDYIVDDKGVVLIANFGLRHSTFPNMVAGRALPATLSIRRSLRDKLSVDCRIGATYGKAYCGCVGGIKRHDYSILGPSVNLAARLMCSSENKGILVDESVRREAKGKFIFKSLPPVVAKGYVKPVRTFEMVESVGTYHQFGSLTNDTSNLISTKIEASKFSTFNLIEERCLQRIDCLDVQTRNFLKFCSVLGREFELSSVLQFYENCHPQETIDNALQRALEEKILIEVNDDAQVYDDFITSLNSVKKNGISTVGQNDAINTERSQIFKFSHEVWWKSLLKIMPKKTKKDFNQAVVTSMFDTPYITA